MNYLDRLRNILRLKKPSQHSSIQEEQLDFVYLGKKVFSEKEGKVYIGGELVNDQLRSLLRDQAKNFQTTNLYEIISATITNEASNILLQAGNLEHLQYGKALHYWNKILMKTINALAK